jgi:hypothetical protein
MPGCQYVGFKPDELSEFSAEAMLRRIIEHSPYDSAVSARFERLSSGQYHLRLSIETAEGPFEAEAIAPEVRSAIDQAEEELFGQIEHWRRTRFHDRTA